jgi:AraC-like DNA-binding protein
VCKHQPCGALTEPSIGKRNRGSLPRSAARRGPARACARWSKHIRQRIDWGATDNLESVGASRVSERGEVTLTCVASPPSAAFTGRDIFFSCAASHGANAHACANALSCAEQAFRKAGPATVLQVGSATHPMAAPTRNTELCFSASLMLPFSRLLRRLQVLPEQDLDRLDAIDPEEHIPISIVTELLTGAIALTGDIDLGLKAAREIQPGDYGALEYAVRTAPTWLAAADAAGRYMRLINEALSFTLQLEGARGVLALESQVPLQRAAVDFQSAAFHVWLKHNWSGTNPGFEVWFPHPRPSDITEYERTFEGGTLHFDASFTGFTFPAEAALLPVPTADVKLHRIIRRQAEVMLANLPSAPTVSQRVCELLTTELAGGTPTLAHVAKLCAVSERTLGRQLEEEKTTFRELLEDLRHRLSLQYVRSSNVPLHEVALLVGFSSASSFHRAFRRWTGSTPLELRRRARNRSRSIPSTR